ncbi:MAG TPA: hypothetical protein VLL50_10900 [Usitatibacter sp.]|nr:hypothetical protein [Usitatibacter sp.]
MDATVIRRYLQPSPALRWHPWAPLAAGLAMLLFIVYFSARWGYSVAKDEQARRPQPAGVAFVMANFIARQSPARAMVYEAEAVDGIVLQGTRASSESASTLSQLREAIEARVFRSGFHVRGAGRSDAQLAAEERLRVFSMTNPSWVRTTATYCAELPINVDLRERYAKTARAYSELLGRTIRPDDLAPAVPELKCHA